MRMKKKPTEQSLIFKNTLFIILIFLIVVAALYFFGALDDDRRELGYKTDAVCLISGHFDGTAELLRRGSLDDGSHIYWFNCSENTVKIQYDSEANIGYIIKLEKGE